MRGELYSQRGGYTVYIGGYRVYIVAFFKPSSFLRIPISRSFFTENSKERFEGVRTIKRELKYKWKALIILNFKAVPGRRKTAGNFRSPCDGGILPYSPIKRKRWMQAGEKQNEWL